MATDLEPSSFLTKFKHLCSSGYEATLQLKSLNGHASVTLDVKLGFVQVTSTAPSVNNSSARKRKRSPSYYRRQELRRNARKSPNVKVNESPVAAAEVAKDGMNENCREPAASNLKYEADEVLVIDKDQAEESLDTVIENEYVCYEENELREELDMLIKDSELKRCIWENRNTQLLKDLAEQGELEDSGVS